MPKSGPGVVKAFQEASEEDRRQIIDGLPYDVGRLKPPAEHRFKKGNKSGRGRPRGSKNMKTQLRNAVQMKVMIKENGRAKKVDASEAGFLQLAAQAAAGDKKAIAMLFEFSRKAGLLGDEVAPASEPMFTENDVGVWQQVSALMSEGTPAGDGAEDPEEGAQ